MRRVKPNLHMEVAAACGLAISAYQKHPWHRRAVSCATREAGKNCGYTVYPPCNERAVADLKKQLPLRAMD